MSVRGLVDEPLGGDGERGGRSQQDRGGLLNHANVLRVMV